MKQKTPEEAFGDFHEACSEFAKIFLEEFKKLFGWLLDIKDD